MPVVKLWSSCHQIKKAIFVSDLNIENLLESAGEKNIYGTRIFLNDGTEIEDNNVLKEYQNEIFIIANEDYNGGEKTPSVGSHTTAPASSAPNSPTSSIDSNISDVSSFFQIPYSKFPSALLSRLNSDEPISSSDLNIIIRTIGDELTHLQKLPTRSIYRAIAQELCDRYPQLYDRDDDTKQLIGSGYYTVFKKIEERVHYLQRPNKRTSNSPCSGKTTRKNSKLIKNLSSGCKEWHPVINEEEEITLETKKSWLKSNASVKERDESKVELYMEDSYGLQRSFLNTIPAPAISTVAIEWPVLLEEKYMIKHFDRLCGLNSDLCMDTFLNKATALQKQISALMPKKQETDNTDNNDIRVLKLIAQYFKEDIGYIYAKYEEPLTKSDIASRVKTTAPNIVVSGIDNISYLLVENTIVSEVGSTSKSSLQVLIAAYYNFNIVYPVQCQNSLEFLQRFVFKINPNEGTKVKKGRTLSKVLSLMSKLKS